MPDEIHHIASNKDPYYTPDFEAIAAKYGLDLDDDWNKITIKHRGKHVWEYHDFILEQMEGYDSIAKGDKSLFLNLWDELRGIISANPEMLYSEFWRKP